MSYYDAPMTKLEAVNICLSSIGEAPVNTLAELAVDAQIASDLIDETSRSVQTRCWYWNREQYKISPNNIGEIKLPSNVVRADSTGYDKYQFDVVQRGNRLFDRTNNTFTFTKPVDIEMWMVLPFGDLPATAKQYVTFRAARLLQQRVLGAESVNKDTKENEASAYAMLIHDEASVEDANMLTDSFSTSSILWRG